MGSAVRQSRPFGHVTLHFAFRKQVAALPLFRLLTSLSIQSNFSDGEEPSQGAGSIPPSQLPPQSSGPVLIPSFSFSFCPSWLHGGFLVFFDF